MTVKRIIMLINCDYWRGSANACVDPTIGILQRKRRSKGWRSEDEVRRFNRRYYFDSWGEVSIGEGVNIVSFVGVQAVVVEIENQQVIRIVIVYVNFAILGHLARAESSASHIHKGRTEELVSGLLEGAAWGRGNIVSDCEVVFPEVIVGVSEGSYGCSFLDEEGLALELGVCYCFAAEIDVLKYVLELSRWVVLDVDSRKLGRSHHRSRAHGTVGAGECIIEERIKGWRLICSKKQYTTNIIFIYTTDSINHMIFCINYNFGQIAKCFEIRVAWQWLYLLIRTRIIGI